MKTIMKFRVRSATCVLLALAAFGWPLAEPDLAPTYHCYYEPQAGQPARAATSAVEFDYGISDTTVGYQVQGIEVKAARFRRNDEDVYGSYDPLRLVRPAAAGLFQYGLLVVLALFAVVWLLVALNRWQRPVHIPARRRTAEHRHLIYLINRHRMNRNIPNPPNRGRKL